MLQPRLVDFAWKPLCSAMFHPSICRTNSTQSFPRLLPTILRLKTRSSFGKVQLPEKGPLCCQDKDVSAAKKNTKKLATLENLNKHPRTHPNLSTDVLKSLRSFRPNKYLWPQEKFGAGSAGLRAISRPGAPGRRPSKNKRAKILCNPCKSGQMRLHGRKMLPSMEHMWQKFDCKSIRNNPQTISRAPHGLQ